MKRIDIVCNDGSPLGVHLSDLYSEGRTGLGGAEQYLMTMCEYWSAVKGYRITLYNNPTKERGSPFAQKQLGEFDQQGERDVLITFRSPNTRSVGAKGKKIWLSCDQRTVGNFSEFARTQDKIVCISPFHQRYFEAAYGIRNTTYTDIPVRLKDYETQFEKVRGQCLFASVPDRGVPVLARAWPMIKERVPHASLVVTGGWSLWTGQDDSQLLFPYRMMFRGQKDVSYLGAVPRRDLLKIQGESDIYLHPCIYDELFCISCAEAQAAGAYPITSSVGALETTNMGTVVSGHPVDRGWLQKFVDAVCIKLEETTLLEQQQTIRKDAQERFSVEKIGEQWDSILFS